MARLTPEETPKLTVVSVEDVEVPLPTAAAQELIEQSRRWENFAFIAGVAILCVHGFAETFVYLCLRMARCTAGSREVPWVQLVIALILIVPKTLGRAQARIIMEAIADRIRGGKKDGSDA